MKFSVVICALAALVVPAVSIHGQGTSSAGSGRGVGLVKAARSADEAWSIVETFVSSRTQPGRRLDPSDPDAFSQSDLYLEASQAAGTFHTAYPGHARVGEARKLEAVYAMQAVQLGASGYRQKADALAAAFRADKKNSDQDRFDVAFLKEGSLLADTLKGKRFIDDGPKYEQLADSLYAEFGDTVPVLGLYVSIARTTDVATATRVATKLLGLKSVPQWVSEQAQAVADRAQLIGKPLDLKLATIGGDTIDLSVPTTRPTVVFLWNVMDGLDASMEMLNHFKPFKVDARWIYVGLGGEQPVSDRPMAGSPFASTHCFVRPQFGNAVTNYLKVNQAPYIFVLNPAGKVIGYGFPENIAALLEAASR
jgi:hypothetical protein